LCFGLWLVCWFGGMDKGANMLLFNI